MIEMTRKERNDKEFKAKLWRMQDVGAVIDGEVVCLKCLDEEEKGRANEDATTSCRCLYADSAEFDEPGFNCCERCENDLVNFGEIIEKEKQERKIRKEIKEWDNRHRNEETDE